MLFFVHKHHPGNSIPTQHLTECYCVHSYVAFTYSEKKCCPDGLLVEDATLWFAFTLFTNWSWVFMDNNTWFQNIQIILSFCFSFIPLKTLLYVHLGDRLLILAISPQEVFRSFTEVKHENTLLHLNKTVRFIRKVSKVKVLVEQNPASRQCFHIIHIYHHFWTQKWTPRQEERFEIFFYWFAQVQQ